MRWEIQYKFVANFLRHITAKNYENWFMNKKVIAKIERVVFLKHSVGIN